MATREVNSASVATFVDRHVELSPEAPWNFGETGQTGVTLDSNTVIRVAPMVRRGGWNTIHFSPQLRLPTEANAKNGMVITFEAMARECVAVALSPSSGFVMGKTYVVHFGAAGNVSTVIRRRLESGTEAVDVAFASRVCLERTWVSYWICLLQNGKLFVGTGKVVGQQCIGCLDDSLYTQLRPDADVCLFVGLGNSALGKSARPLKIRHVCVTTVPDYLESLLQGLPTELPLVSVEENDDETKAVMEEYQKECQKNRARAQKFGIPYKEPSPQAFLQWSQARKLRANPEKGFITGMDITSPEELAKQETRKARFGLTEHKRKGQVDEGEPSAEVTPQDAIMEEDDGPLPVTQAWENEKLVREHRTDPPVSLYVHPPPSAEEREETEEFAMDVTQEVTLVPEKIHMMSIDWVAFKQIRTADIMAYFEDYGPSYVEWLGELSCNVQFEDKFSASRALHHMSQELPTPPPLPEAQQPSAFDSDEPEALPDFGNMGWRFCQQPIRKVSDDRYGRKGTKARVLMRVANSADILAERPKTKPKPPPGFTTKRVLGPGSEYDTESHRKKRRRVDAESFDPNSGDEHPALDRGLRSGREGFSVEDLEIERARKLEGDTFVKRESS